MKRIGKLFEQITDIGNLRLADDRASRGKSGQYGVQVHRRSREENLFKLQTMLLDKTFRTSQYTTFKVYETKDKCLRLAISLNGARHVIFTGSKVLRGQIQSVPKEKFPFVTTIIKEDEHYEFT